VKFEPELYKLCDRIATLAPWNVISIILTGSLSRGEGTTVREKNTVHVLSDYDLEVIVRLYDPLFVRRIGHLEKKSPLNVKIGVLPVFSLKNLKLIQMYELKKKGVVLLGDKNVLNLIPLETPSDIPLLEGIRRLLNGIMEMVEALIYETMTGNMSRSQSLKICYSSSKAYLACCSALLTLIGEYRPTYRERCKVFNDVFRSKFKRLNETFPDFPEKVQRALNLKLQPEISEFKNSLEELFNTKDYILTTLEYYLSQYLLEKQSDLFTSLEKLKTLPIQPMFNFYYALNLILFLKKVPPLKSFFTVPMIHTQISAVYLMYSIHKDGSIDLEMLQTARNFINKIYPTKGIPLDWNALREITIKTWKIAPVYTSR
jgi:predicted nucleotidyltransferase